MLTRDNEDRVTAAIESRLFNVFTNRTERVDGIRSITIVPQSEVGADRIVFETDCPFLAPQKHRGQWPNEPALVRETLLRLIRGA